MHPEAEAFLDAIFDSPEDNTLRLVYADWLQEHGHDDYAQFIRVQCSVQPRIRDAKHAEKKILVEELWAAWQAFRARLPERVRERFSDLHRFDRGMAQIGRYGDLSVAGFLAESPAWVPVPAPLTVEICCDTETPPFGDAPYLAHVRKLSIITNRDRLLNWSGTWPDETRTFPGALRDEQFGDLLRSSRLAKLRSLDIDLVDARASTVARLADAPLLDSVRNVSLWFRTDSDPELQLTFSATDGADARRSARAFWEEHRDRFRR
jgi:uncharacterized protein (TIGR02996 family)